MKWFTKAVICTLLVYIPAFSQTPCIDAAKAGMIGDCLMTTVNPSQAKWVAVEKVPGYVVASGLNSATRLEFSTKEQALAIMELIKFAQPGIKLMLVDMQPFLYFPPFRRLDYGNLGGMFDPRIYEIHGDVNIGVGWFVNVERLIFGGNFDTQELGYPFGNTTLVLIPLYGGGLAPKWVGGPRQEALTPTVVW